MVAIPHAGYSGWSSQHTLVSGSQNLPIGSDVSGLASPGLMLSGGNPLTRRQHTMPAGDRYLASQRRSQLGAGTASNGPVTTATSANLGSSVVSPRQKRMQSPIRNYHLVQRVDVPAQVPEHQLRRQQATSPVRGESQRDG